MLHKVNFEVEFNRFKPKVFLLQNINKAKTPSLPDYLPIAGWRTNGFLTFVSILVLGEMQSV